MTDSSPTPPNRQDPQLDPPDDADEPAFDWMKPSTTDKRSAAASDSSAGGGAGTTPEHPPRTDSTPGSSAPDPASRQAGSRADRKAAEAAVEPTPKVNGAHFSEPLPTSALQIRPPEEEVRRRNAEREQAANAKPVAPRVMQVVLAVCFPVILLVLAVRTVASPLFLWVEYNRPGFPGDGYGFNTDDRMTYGSYAVDYLSNWAGPRYLGELVNRSGDKLFGGGEVSHMADVKVVILSTFGAGLVLILLSLIAVIYLRRRSPGGVRRGLFAGSIITLVVILSLGVLAVLGWEQFFAEFHSIFFASGTWTFSLQDTLIRLFPAQFWVDGGIVIGGLVLITSLVTLILTWPTRKRRGLPKRGAAAVDPAGDESTDAGRADADPAGAVPAKRSLFRRDKAGDAAAADASEPDSAAGSSTTTGSPDTGSHDTPTRGYSSTI
ncbi:TIGR01906 family membrane protein [Arthrobacter sp. PsM3]|uniref:TIGR01906 family membrane protein n=1 Tax=Arthrobacter sp. PsM3 TaxID=3030531 RepID=UPI00263B4110|nr:TIGR01906 family membrane protein [Arthrobacter sp. PsM3]MDN4646511.1 TIGR01906 family membrane protein [Arthrobacter sp. PsM3]